MSRQPMLRYLFPLVPIVGAAITLLVGCDLPPRPILSPVVITKPMPTDAPLNETLPATVEPPSKVANEPWEIWDAYFIDGEHVGYSHLAAEPSGPITRGSIHYTLDHRVYRRQGDARILQRVTLTSNETDAGRLLDFEAMSQLGPKFTRTTGELRNSKFIVETMADSSAEIREIPWETHYRGLFAIEQSLRAKPLLVPGETRMLQLLLMGPYRPATVRLRCSGPALVPLIDGTETELNEINVEIRVPDSPPTYSAIWTDSEGDIKRTYAPAANMIGYRTTQEQATAIADDDLVPLTLAVSGELERPSEARRVAYRLTPIDPEELPVSMDFAKVPGQYVRINDDGVADVLVSRILEVPSETFQTGTLTPTEEDWRFNYFIDSRSELVQKFAGAAVEKQNLTKHQAAAELTETANRLVRYEPSSVGLAKASQIARLAKGDSTQSAILLAALLRAEHIPSRLAIGLKYDPQHNRMVSHVWTMAHTDAGWIYLDALDGVPAAADRLVFYTTNFAERNEGDAFNVLLETAGRIKLDILAAKYDVPDEPPLVKP